MVNVREQCSWVHEDREAATGKAIDLVRMMVEKVKRNEDLFPIKVPLTRRALVVGGGIAGIQAALDMANAGIPVVLVEKEPSIGGHMSQLSETFPTLDCSQCILTPRMVEVAQHPLITLHTYSEVEKVEGYVGNFRVTIRKKARSVDMAKCTGCGVCQQKCPQKKIPSEFDAGLGNRAAIYIPFPQAVPNKPVIDRERCTHFKTGKCGVCAKVCGPGAVDFEQQDELVVENVGAVVLATGYELYDIGNPDAGLRGYPEYGGGQIKDVIDGLQFERLASASGPTGGEIRRPSDGKIPQTVVFLQCVGSRDPAKGIAYCSKICCMYTAKHALLYKHKVHDGQGRRLLHGRARAGQGLRRVRAARRRGGRGPLPARQGVAAVRGQRPDRRVGRRHARRHADGDPGRPGRARHGDPRAGRRGAAGAEVRRRLRRPRASTPRRTRSCVRSSRRPPASCWRAPARGRRTFPRRWRRRARRRPRWPSCSRARCSSASRSWRA